MSATASTTVKRFVRSDLLVMQGLLEDATRCDREVAEQNGLTRSTVAAARRRLVKSGAIRYAQIPFFNKLGCEMIGYHVGTADLSVSLEKRASMYEEFTRKAPQIFFGIIGPSVAVFYTTLRSVTEHERFIHSYNKFFSGPIRGYRAPLRSDMFPYAVSLGTYDFNFAPAIHHYFKIEGESPKPRLPWTEDVEEPDMTPSERRVFVALVEEPWSSDERVSRTVGVSRQAVTGARHRFADNGLMVPAWIPDFRTCGFEIFASARSRVRAEVPWGVVNEDMELKEILSLAFFTLAKPGEAIGNYAHPDFQSYSELSEKALRGLEQMRILDSDPEVILVSLTRGTVLRHLDFGPATRNLLLGNRGS